VFTQRGKKRRGEKSTLGYGGVGVEIKNGPCLYTGERRRGKREDWLPAIFEGEKKKGKGLQVGEGPPIFTPTAPRRGRKKCLLTLERKGRGKG